MKPHILHRFESVLSISNAMRTKAGRTENGLKSPASRTCNAENTKPITKGLVQKLLALQPDAIKSPIATKAFSKSGAQINALATRDKVTASCA